MILQLSPPIPITTPKGKALAHAIVDTGIENEIQWICFQDSTGECWTWKNPDIRAQKNITHGRDHISPFYNPQLVALKKEGGYFCMECNGHNECDCEEDEEEDDAYEELHEEYIQSKKTLIQHQMKINLLEDQLSEIRNTLRFMYNEEKIDDNLRIRVKDILLKSDELIVGIDGKIIKVNAKY